MPDKKSMYLSPYLNKNKMNEDTFDIDLKLIDMADLQQEIALPENYFDDQI